MQLDELLRKEIQTEVEALEGMEVGSKEYSATVDGVTKLMDRAIEIEKINIEHQERVESREEDNRIKTKQMKDEQKDRLVKNAISVGSILATIGVTVWGTKKSFEFEKEGTITTIMGRGFINKLLPKK